MLRGRRVSSLTIRPEGKNWRKDWREKGSSLAASGVLGMDSCDISFRDYKKPLSHRLLSHHLDCLNIWDSR
jgi:hypothetical protein